MIDLIRACRIGCLAFLLLAIAGVAGCKKDAGSGAAPSEPAAAPAQSPGATLATLSDLQRADRKVIKNAELDIGVESPGAAQKRASAIAAEHGGYLVSAEQTAGARDDATEPTSVKLVLRVNADKFDAALEALRRLGKRAGSEKISSKDVTEEYIDVEARIKTQKKLEEQYLEILKSASKVDDALAVQKQLAEVRGELEKLEGKKRFFDNQVALSTITVTFEQDKPLISVSSSAFGRAFKHASADLINVSAGIVIGAIRLVGVLLPVTLLVLLPLFLIGRRLVRRLTAAS